MHEIVITDVIKDLSSHRKIYWLAVMLETVFLHQKEIWLFYKVFEGIAS